MKLTVTLIYKSIFFSGYSGYDNSLRKHKFIHFNSVQIYHLLEKEFPSNNNIFCMTTIGDLFYFSVLA